MVESCSPGSIRAMAGTSHRAEVATAGHDGGIVSAGAGLLLESLESPAWGER